MSVVNEYNGLNAGIERSEVIRLADQAHAEGQMVLYTHLMNILEQSKEFDNVIFRRKTVAIEQVSQHDLPGLEEMPDYIDEDEFTGLNKAVSPDQIYQMITDKMINFIKEAKRSDYKKKWKGKEYGTGYLIPFNFVSKKRYRGVNSFMLTDFIEPLKNPFFLTFKQVGELGGKVKKDSKGNEVVYFTRLYRYEQAEPKLSFATYNEEKFKKWFAENKHLIPEKHHKKSHAIPILKYYNVYNGKDIEGIDFDLKNFKIGYIENELPPNVPFPIADAIVENFPSPKVQIKHGGDKASYTPALDTVKMPYKADFETGQDYYRTLFHELGHSTGSSKRLDRDMTGAFGSKEYAFEELIAEFISVFVSAEAGFMWHTNKNHAGYLKGWNEVLTQIEEDNRFVMRAASKAQEAADFILQPDKNGNPLYLKTIASETSKETTEEKPTYKVGDSFYSTSSEKEFTIIKIDTDGAVHIDSNPPSGKISNQDIINKSQFRKFLKDGVFKGVATKKEEKKIQTKKYTKEKFISDLPDYETIRNSYRGMSFSPEERAKNELEDWGNSMAETYTLNLKKAKEQNAVDDFHDAFDTYYPRLLKRKVKMISSRQGVMSTMITGRGGYPVRSQQKKHDRYDDAIGEYVKYLKYFDQKLFSAIYKRGAITSGESDTLRKLREKLEEKEAIHKLMVETNKAAREFQKHKDVEKLKKKYSHFKPKLIKEITELKTGEKAIPAYMLTNSNAEIRRIKQRIKDEENRSKEYEGGSKTTEYENFTVVENVDENRLQIIFDGKPEDEVRSILKRYAFVFSRKNNAWQRQLTRNAVSTFEHNALPKLQEFYGENTEPKKENTPQKKEEKPKKQPKKGKVTSTGQMALFGTRSKRKKGLRSPETQQEAVHSGEGRPSFSGKIQSIAAETQQNPLFSIAGETSRFLQAVERKPYGSVVVTLDGPQGSGKTTSVYKFLNDFASVGNRCLFASLEEHPTSNLAIEKRDIYLSPEAQRNIDTIAEFESYKEFAEIVHHYDAIFIDSWQKLTRMIGNIKLDEDVRKAFDGKVFFVIFQQTVTGRTKGGAEIVFDGDIIIKLEKMPSFADNYAYFDKNRYTTMPIENIRYMIADGVTIITSEIEAQDTPEPQPEPEQPEQPGAYNFTVY